MTWNVYFSCLSLLSFGARQTQAYTITPGLAGFCDHLQLGNRAETPSFIYLWGKAITSNAVFMATLRSGLAPQKAKEGTWPRVVPLWPCKEAFSKLKPEALQLETPALKPVEPMTQDPGSRFI